MSTSLPQLRFAVLFLAPAKGGPFYTAAGLGISDATERGCLTPPDGFQRRSRSEFDTTETELKAIAPAAMTGFKNPKSPRG